MGLKTGDISILLLEIDQKKLFKMARNMAV